MSILLGEKVKAIQVVVKGLKEGKMIIAKVAKRGRGDYRYPYLNIPEEVVKLLGLELGTPLTTQIGAGFVEYKLSSRGDVRVVKGNSRGTTLRVRFPVDYEGAVIIELVEGGFRVYYS